ncbi:MAG: molybdopterin-dependent oxidoreductase [Planctomycetes bacterium]|nr:molybdopterin-dependent oxidoreductase [Planctomycetota bacterium]
MAIQPIDGTIRLTVNGRQSIPISEPDGLSLLDALRDQLGLISPKDGCQPLGQCGCCTVLIDGKPRLSCTIKASSVVGKEITTLEGLPEETRKRIADAFVECGGVQCGFCIPGIAIRGHALCERKPNPTREEIALDLRAHLCRCTGYTKIVDAIESLAEKRQNAEAGGNENGASHNHQITKSPNHQIERVGGRLNRYTGADAVLGDRHYIDDIVIPDMAHAAMRFSDHPRALVKRIDTSEAEALEGVIRIATAKDVPGKRFVGLIIPDWPIFIAEGEETRCVGDILAAVLAVDEKTARRATELIDVEYDIREPLTTPDDALKPDAPQIHPKGNLLSRSALVRGEVDAAFANSAHIVEGIWQTQAIEHMFLEPEACIAIPFALADGFANSWREFQSGARHMADDRTPHDQLGMHLLTQGQGIFDDRRQCCSILGWAHERMHAELVSNGGAFGGKEDMSIQGQTALLAYLARMPVKTVLTRKESIRLHPKRHPVRTHLRVGADADGRITALRARIVGDKGAYASVGMKVLERAAGHAAGPYRIPAIDIEALAVYTNNPPCGAMRGFGANQSAFAIEGALDLIAEKVGIDGWEIRSRNILEPGDRFCTGQLLTKPFGLRQTLESVKDIYRNAKFAGIACGIKNVGIGNGLPEAGRATLTVEPDGRITIRTGFTEMGQGLFTILIQTAVEETGLPAEIFEARADTRDAIDCGQTTGSRGTVLGAYGVVEAAKKLKADLDAGKSLGELAGQVYHGEWVCYKTDKFGAPVENPVTHLTYGFATQVVILDDDGKLKKVVAAHDVGRAMNPTLLEGQVEGSIHMGLGYALSEAFVVENGHIVTDDVKSNGVLRAHHMPEIECIIVETADPDTPYGARGVGEIGLVPTAPAVAGALYSFDKIRRFTLPMKDSPAARAMTGK